MSLENVEKLQCHSNNKGFIERIDVTKLDETSIAKSRNIDDVDSWTTDEVLLNAGERITNVSYITKTANFVTHEGDCVDDNGGDAPSTKINDKTGNECMAICKNEATCTGWMRESDGDCKWYTGVVKGEDAVNYPRANQNKMVTLNKKCDNSYELSTTMRYVEDCARATMDNTT